MQIVNDAYLIEHFCLTKEFINRNAPKWGAFSRPRKHILEEVEKFISNLSAAKRQKYSTPTQKIAQRKLVNDLVNEVLFKQTKQRRVANG